MFFFFLIFISIIFYVAEKVTSFFFFFWCNRKGLSRYYSGKSRSFTCMEEVHSVEDLKKPEHPDAKKRKKYSERNKELR